MKKVVREDKYSSPPARYNPSSVLKKMEEAGIGTKATRADILQTLYNRGYIMENRVIVTDLGFDVVDVLNRYCPRVLSLKLTRGLEEKMDAIQNNSLTREEVLVEAVGRLKPLLPSGNVAPDLRVMTSYIWWFCYILVETSMQREPFRKFCVIGCLRCGLLQVVRTDRKTRRCPGCGYVNQLDFSRIKVWFKTDKTSEAVYALQRLKMMQKTGKLK